MTPATLRSSLAALLASEVGRYSSGSGAADRASIWVGSVTPDGYSMNLDFAKRLEVLIYPTGEYAQIPEFGVMQRTQDLRVVLKDWTPHNLAPQSTATATELILERYRVPRSPTLVAATRDTVEQVTIFIRER